MKNSLGMIAVLTVLVSCGGSSDSKKSEGSMLDPLTVDKYEEQLRDSVAGMNATKTTTGTTIDLVQVGGRWTGTTKPENRVEKEIILKIDGDAMYSLVEETDDNGTDRRVKKESIEALVRSSSKPLPKGFKRTQMGDILTLTGKINMDFEIEPGVMMRSSSIANYTVNTNDFRCTGMMKMKMNMKIGGTKLPQTESQEVTNCGTNLSAAALKAINLTNMKLCIVKEDTEEHEDSESCTYGNDLSYLVQ